MKSLQLTLTTSMTAFYKQSIMKTQKSLLILILSTLINGSVFAQDPKMPPPPDEKTRERIEAARAAVITQQLNLTPEQATKFWPIYNEFSQKRELLRREFFEERRKIDPANPNPKAEKDVFNLGLNIRQKELDLEKEYSTRMMGVISGQQMLKLRHAERNFQQMVMNQLQQRRNMQQRKENFRERNQQLRPRGN